METLGNKDPQAVSSSADFWKKVLVPLTTFTILSLIGWGISLSIRISLIEEREQTETKIINEFINQERITFDKTQTTVEDIKIKLIVLDASVRDGFMRREYPAPDTVIKKIK